MKKRILFSIVSSVIVLLLSVKLWLFEFNFCIFFIIAFVSFLIFFRLFIYVQKLIEDGNISNLDKIFLTICIILLLIPISFIDKSEYSNKEHRKLASWKPLISDKGEINYNFNKDFDAWISDRFALRGCLVTLYNNFSYLVSDKYYVNKKGYLNKKTNWMYLNTNSLKLSEQDSDEIISSINLFNDFCKKNNIKLYVLIVPEKNYIYHDGFNLKHKDSIDRTVNFINKIQKSINIPIIFPYPELLKASKDDFVFFKVDHHWTDFGAFVGYNALMKIICKDFPNLKVVLKSDFLIAKSKLIRSDWERKFFKGNTYRVFNISKIFANKILDTEYAYYLHRDNKNMEEFVIDTTGLKQKDFKYVNGANKKALIIGSSMNENFCEIFPYTFKDTRYYRLNNVFGINAADEYKIMKRFKNGIVEYKPDILILSITQDKILFLKDIIKD